MNYQWFLSTVNYLFILFIFDLHFMALFEISLAQIYISYCICLIEWIHNFSKFFCLVFFSLVLLFPLNTDIFFVLVWASKITAPVSYFLKIHFWTVTYQTLLLSPHNHNFSISVSNDLMVWWMTLLTSE